MAISCSILAWGCKESDTAQRLNNNRVFMQPIPGFYLRGFANMFALQLTTLLGSLIAACSVLFFWVFMLSKYSGAFVPSLYIWKLSLPGRFCIFRMEGSSPVFVFHRTKLKNQEYETLDHLECDLNLMFENAKRYNVPNSAIYKRVLKLQQVMQV